MSFFHVVPWFLADVIFLHAAGRPPKSQVVIRRPPQVKPHPRAHVLDDETRDCIVQASSSSTSLEQSSLASTQDIAMDDTPDELTRIRTLLRPPPIPGVEDWGILPPSSERCDPGIEVCSHFANDTLYSYRPPDKTGTICGAKAGLRESQAFQ